MTTKSQRSLLVLSLLGVILIIFWVVENTQAQGEAFHPLVIGKLRDTQNHPIAGALVTLVDSFEDRPLAETTTQPDGLFAITMSDALHNEGSGTVNTGNVVLPLDDFLPDALTIHIERAHFAEASIPLTPEDIQHLRFGDTVTLPEITLQRRIGIAF